MKKNFKIKFDFQLIKILMKFLYDNGFEFHNNIPYTRFTAKNDEITIILYNKGTLLFQGNLAEKYYNEINEVLYNTKSLLNIINEKEKPITPLDYQFDIIGNDESGKGDVFGGLTVASVYVDEKASKVLRHYGIDDSKKIKDDKIFQLAEIIRENCVYEVYTIEPEIYNRLYSKYNNLNILLANAHVYVIERLIKRVKNFKTVIIDNFSRTDIFKPIFNQKRIDINYDLIVKAEQNVAVAAASILARDAFLDMLERLRYKYSIDFPKGASIVKGALREFVNSYSYNDLNQVSKVHFKTIKELKLR